MALIEFLRRGSQKDHSLLINSYQTPEDCCILKLNASATPHNHDWQVVHTVMYLQCTATCSSICNKLMQYLGGAYLILLSSELGFLSERDVWLEQVFILINCSITHCTTPSRIKKYAVACVQIQAKNCCTIQL